MSGAKNRALSVSGVCVLFIVANGVAWSQEELTISLNEVTVTATRIAAASYDVPASISSVAGASLRDAALGINLADDVAQVPGLLARNRNNYAQDQQVSIRGIGANSAFGIRGVRIYQDGMPGTSPDGQGQISQFNLDSAARVEILRGPFSALYGNSAGGVIQIFTADGHGPMTARAGLARGSFGAWRANANVSGGVDALGYNVDFTHFATDGFRNHSEARSESFNAKLNYAINDAQRVTLLANVISRPDSQDPQGITEAQFYADPRQTTAVATSFNTRKSLQQEQAGAIYDAQLMGGQALRVLGYYGRRSVEQFLSVPTGAQIPATSSGGVIDLDREYAGGDARWSWEGAWLDRSATLIAGVAYDRQNEHRRGYNNFIGAAPNQTLGVKGALRRDENNIASETAQYAQGTWEVAPQWSLMAGVRRSRIEIDSQDHYIATGNGDDSGRTAFAATTPAAGVMFKAQPWLHLYGSYGRGFQTPTGSELAYNASGAPGLNLALRAARGRNLEIGAKVKQDDLSVEAALFDTRTSNEIVINTNSGGRSTYQNAGRTQRQGAELSVAYRFAEEWRGQMSYTYLDATYSDAFLTCVATPCTLLNKVAVAAGSRLPGVPENNVYAAIRWGRGGWFASLSAQYLSDVVVNDLNTTFAPSYTLVGALAGYGMELSGHKLSAFVRVDNVLDEDYVGSIIVNDGNGRFFEPGAPRSALVGVSFSWR